MAEAIKWVAGLNPGVHMRVGFPASLLGFTVYRIPVDVVLRTGNVLVLLRWTAIPFLGVLGLVAPPRMPLLVVLIILAVSLYNGWATVALAGADRVLAVRSLRAAACLDALMLFLVVIIYEGNPPGGSIYGFYSVILIDLALYWDAIAVIPGLIVFTLAISGVEWLKALVWGQPFSLPQVLLWTLVMVVVGMAIGVVFNTLAASLNLAQAVAEPTVATSGPAASVIKLSSREQEVLRLVADGYSNTMIASRLHLSENTVKGYVESLLGRLNARNRAEAVAAASRLNLL